MMIKSGKWCILNVRAVHDIRPQKVCMLSLLKRGMILVTWPRLCHWKHTVINYTVNKVSVPSNPLPHYIWVFMAFYIFVCTRLFLSTHLKSVFKNNANTLPVVRLSLKCLSDYKEVMCTVCVGKKRLRGRERLQLRDAKLDCSSIGHQ